MVPAGFNAVAAVSPAPTFQSGLSLTFLGNYGRTFFIAFCQTSANFSQPDALGWISFSQSPLLPVAAGSAAASVPLVGTQCSPLRPWQ